MKQIDIFSPIFKATQAWPNIRQNWELQWSLVSHNEAV